MDVLLLSFSYVAPFLVYMLLGYGSKRVFKIKSETFLDLNTIVFKIFLPLSLFFNVYNSDFESVDFSKPLLIGIIGTLVIFLFFLVFYSRRKLAKADKSVMIQNSFRSNLILFGIPLTQSIMGTSISGLAGIMIAIIVPLFNILAVIVLAIYANEKISFFKTIWNIIKNPLIIASIIAILLRYFNVILPELVVDIMSPLGSLATPLALLALGGRFSFKTDRNIRKLLIEGTFIRLILVPFVGLAVALLLDVRGEALALLLTLFGGPVAVSSYTMAQQMGGNDKLAAQLLVYTTILSSFTLFIFISLFKAFAYF